MSGQQGTRWLMAVFVIALAILVFRGVLVARTYPQVHDAAIMRYVTFMIDRGHAPYISMVEMNLPGTLMTEWFSRHVFGDGAAGLWRWDTCIGLIAVAAASWLAGPGHREAAMCGVLLAWLLHQADGARDFAQRDWFLGAIMLLAAACVAEYARKQRAPWMAPAMGLAVWAAAIKPFALLFLFAPLVVAAVRPDRFGQRWRPLGWSAVGGCIPVLAIALYFLHWQGSFTAFLTTERSLGAWYAQLDRAPLVSMVTQVLLFSTFAVLVLTSYLWARTRGWTYPGDALLFTGFLCGAGMYLLQRKGFNYQTYPMLMFGFPCAFVTAQRALPATRSQRLIAVVLLLCAVWALPVQLAHRKKMQVYPDGAQWALVRDLQRLGGRQLSGQVQCLDMTLGGCIGALAELHLEQSTGFVNDHTLFPYSHEPVLDAWQQRFLAEMQSAAPRVIVMSNHNWPNEQDRSFSKLGRWPAFAQFLRRNYRLEGGHVEARTAASGASYRIYVRS